MLNSKILYLRLIRPVIHFSIILGIFYLVYIIRQKTDLIPFIHLKIPYLNLKETIIFSILSAILFIVIWSFFSIYKLNGPIHWYYKKLFKAWLIWFIFISVIWYYWYGYIFQSWISRLVIFWWWIFSLFWLLFVDIVINNLNFKLEKKYPYKLLVLFKDKNLGEKIISVLKTYDIYKVSSQKVDKLKEFLKYNNINLPEFPFKEYDIILTVWQRNKDELQLLTDWTRLVSKFHYHVNDSFLLEDLLFQPFRLWPLLVLWYKPSTLEWRWRVFKRMFDIIFSIVFIMLFWRLYVIIAIYIWVKDWRPIIYKSKRVGRGGKIFEMYKFRTMVKDADKLKQKLIEKNERKWPLFKLTDDPRIPSWWKFLRKFSLDEIPQFFNVLKWDMSVVGPRPHLPEEISKYTWWQKRLLTVKPWITWYAQIFWRDKLDFDEEAKLDLYYIQNWSLFLDIYIIFMTLKVIASWR